VRPHRKHTDELEVRAVLPPSSLDIYSCIYAKHAVACYLMAHPMGPTEGAADLFL
jgi:hypothetical protein